MLEKERKFRRRLFTSSNKKAWCTCKLLLVFQNNETAAMLVYQDNPVGIELFYYVKTFFCPYKLA